MEDTKPDIMVTPTEQVSKLSGKKKRKRAAKHSLKYFQQLQKKIKESGDQDSFGSLIVPVYLGDEAGIDSYEMKEFRKAFKDN